MAVIAVTSLKLLASRSASVGGDPNLKLIRSSRTLLRFLQCELPMPEPPAETPQAPVITVCDKLAAGEK